MEWNGTEKVKNRTAESAWNAPMYLCPMEHSRDCVTLVDSILLHLWLHHGTAQKESFSGCYLLCYLQSIRTNRFVIM